MATEAVRVGWTGCWKGLDKVRDEMQDNNHNKNNSGKAEDVEFVVNTYHEGVPPRRLRAP